jgi:ABC-type Na+ efflux pump permease subunit
MADAVGRVGIDQRAGRGEAHAHDDQPSSPTPPPGADGDHRVEHPESLRLGGANLLAGITFRELLRRPGGWVATMLTGLLFALLVGAVGLTSERVQDRVEDRSFKVAIGGDLAGAQQVLAELKTPRLAFAESPNVAEDVTLNRASSGIVFPEGVDRRLAAGEPVELQMFLRSSQNTSVESFNTVGVRLQESELTRLAKAKGVSVATGGGAQVEVLDLPRDEAVNRVLLARQVAPIAALICIGVVTSVASVFGAARERRSIEPLLVLPLRRESITLGISLGAYPLACLQVLGAVGLLVLTAALPNSSTHQSGGTVMVMLAAGFAGSLVLALVATGFGCLAGSLGTGSDDAVSIGDLVAIVFVVAGVLVFMAPTIGDTPIFDAIPVLGQVLLIRDLVSGIVNPLGILLSLLSALAVFLGAVRFAGRRLEDEKRLARAIR